MPNRSPPPTRDRGNTHVGESLGTSNHSPPRGRLGLPRAQPTPPSTEPPPAAELGAAVTGRHAPMPTPARAARRLWGSALPPEGSMRAGPCPPSITACVHSRARAVMGRKRSTFGTSTSLWRSLPLRFDHACASNDTNWARFQQPRPGLGTVIGDHDIHIGPRPTRGLAWLLHAAFRSESVRPTMAYQTHPESGFIWGRGPLGDPKVQLNPRSPAHPQPLPRPPKRFCPSPACLKTNPSSGGLEYDGARLLSYVGASSQARCADGPGRSFASSNVANSIVARRSVSSPSHAAPATVRSSAGERCLRFALQARLRHFANLIYVVLVALVADHAKRAEVGDQRRRLHRRHRSYKSAE